VSKGGKRKLKERNNNQNFELIQIGGIVPVFVGSDALDSWESNGDSSGSVFGRIRKLCAFDFPDLRSDCKEGIESNELF
jgi:hypothetical protein